MSAFERVGCRVVSGWPEEGKRNRNCVSPGLRGDTAKEGDGRGTEGTVFTMNGGLAAKRRDVLRVTIVSLLRPSGRPTARESA